MFLYSSLDITDQVVQILSQEFARGNENLNPDIDANLMVIHAVANHFDCNLIWFVPK